MCSTFDLASLLRNPDTDRGFAILQRATSPYVEIIAGRVRQYRLLSEIPLAARRGRLPVLILIPFRQVSERGLPCVDDGAPIRCIVADEYSVMPGEQLITVAEADAALREVRFAESDPDYAALVQRIIADEIGNGAGSNFVIRRDLLGEIHFRRPSDRAVHALVVFRRLLTAARGTYWKFALQFADLTLIGASPERHIALSGNQMEMTPMSGTFRYPRGTDALSPLFAFLHDRKEIEELHMVVDEELKMMTKACAEKVTLTGPFLRIMDQLAHTEYQLSGVTANPIADVLRDSMFAPTVTGSPLENAFRVIARYENSGRGYYAGIVGLITADQDGLPTLDSAIVIRTAAITPRGNLTLSVGATLVRDSKPHDEVLETHVKAAGLISVLNGTTSSIGPTPHPAVTRLQQPDAVELAAQALGNRNLALSEFWLGRETMPQPGHLRAQRALVVNMEDDWTHVLAYILRHLGLEVTEVAWQEAAQHHHGGTAHDADLFELLVAGPGPGDPRQQEEPRISSMTRILRHRLQTRLPLLAVCLSHQILCQLYGFPLRRLDPPQQGLARDITIAGREIRVGFYNSFAATMNDDRPTPPGLDIWFDETSREIHGFRSVHALSLQFHIESILSRDGVGLVREFLPGILRPEVSRP